MLDNQIVTVHSNGINQDRSYQDKNDVTFALNCIRDSHEGGRQEYQSEPGNEIATNISSGYVFVGSIYGQDDETYIFSTDGFNSEIGVYKDGTYTILVNSDCLGFDTKYPITGEYRVRNGCERTIYWCDKQNPDYWYNIDRPDDFKTLGVFDCNKFKHIPSILPIKTDLVAVNDFGGILPLGSYYFQPEILDKNENVIYTGELTPQTVVYDDNQNSNYYKIDGGLNIEQYDPAVGGIPLTNKSITLRFYNLDTSFTYLRVNVFRSINGTQVIDGHTVGSLIPITADSIDWTYRGYNTSAGDFPIDVSEKLIDNTMYESAYISEQVQNRYIRANLKQSNRDYSNYQRFASRATMKWVAKEVLADTSNELGNPKNPQTYWTCRGFQGDEAYAPGIQYVHTDGTISPVFLLIGRAADTNDTQLLQVVDNTDPLIGNKVWQSDVDHLGLNLGDEIERWKVFNTASITDINNTTHPYNYAGNFAYYESTETYPDIRDCDGNLIWGADHDGNDITTSTKIRLIKFPDRRLIPHINIDGQYTMPFGIQFDNIEYPNSDIIGHRFVFADRTEFDKTVVDAGWAVTPFTTVDNKIRIGGQVDDPFFHGFYAPGTLGSHMVRYISGKTLFDNSLGSFNYYKTNRVHKFETGLVHNNGNTDYSRINLDGGGRLFSIILDMHTTNNNTPFRTNHAEEQTVLIQSNSVNPSIGLIPEVIHEDRYTGDSISYVTYGFEDTDPLLGSQLVDTVRTGLNTEFKVHNFYTYKKSEIIPYTNILGRTFKSINYNYVSSLLPEDNTFYGGDTIINECTTFRLAPYYANGVGNDNYAYTPYFRHHFIEQQINTALRHSGSELGSRYYKFGDVDQYNYDKLTDPNNPGARILKDFADIIPEYYSYNKDFTLRLYDKAKLAIPPQFDYCSRCYGHYPNRLIFSPKSFDEENFDLYRINKVNDYIDLPAHRGQITGLKYQNNQLLVHCEDTTFVLQPNPQQIQTDQNTAYLSTGDFLSIPPQELMQTDVGLGGMQSKQSMCDTPFGHCWVDQKRGDVLSWNGQIQMLTNGLTQWFKEYLPSDIKKEYFRVTHEDYPIKSTLDLNGYGVILYYDPRFKRLLVSKRDFKPINFVLTPGSGKFIMYNGTWYTIINGDTYPVLPHGENNGENLPAPPYFEDKSWTLSYNFLDQAWCSWHSYIPYHAFSDSVNFYTTVYDRPIWRHLHKSRYQNYYFNKYDMIIEWMNLDPITSSNSSVYYVGYSHLWDDVNKKFTTVDSTFDRMIVYNNDQSTGLQTLQLLNQHTNPYGNNKLLPNIKSVIRTDQNYKISGLYDMAIGQPVMSNSWTLKQLYSGYIDYVPNTTQIDFNKNAYDWGNITDKFSYIRLFYKPSLDYKKTVLLQVANNQQSVR